MADRGPSEQWDQVAADVRLRKAEFEVHSDPSRHSSFKGCDLCAHCLCM